MNKNAPSLFRAIDEFCKRLNPGLGAVAALLGFLVMVQMVAIDFRNISDVVSSIGMDSDAQTAQPISLAELSLQSDGAPIGKPMEAVTSRLAIYYLQW